MPNIVKGRYVVLQRKEFRGLWLIGFGVVYVCIAGGTMRRSVCFGSRAVCELCFRCKVMTHDSIPVFNCAVAFAGGDSDQCFEPSHVVVGRLVVALLRKARVVP